MVSTPSPPKTPDPYRTAQAQGSSNVDTAIAQTALNNANAVTPYGSVVYNQRTDVNGRPMSYQMEYDVFDKKGKVKRRDTRDIPLWESVTTLTPEMQEIFDKQTELQSYLMGAARDQFGRINDKISTPLNFDDLPEWERAAATPDFGYNATTGEFEGLMPFRERAEAAYLSRANPQIERDRAALESRLAAQGITPGSAAYETAMDRYGRQANDLRTQAILAGGQEMNQAAGLLSQAFSQNMQARDFNNDIRAKMMQERITERSQPINEITALMSGGQVTVPQAQPYRPAQFAPPDIQGNVWQAANMDMQKYQSAVQQSNAAMSGLFGMGSSLIGGLFSMSDRRVKTGVVKLGELANGLPFYAFRFKSGGPVQFGVMAQEVQAVAPDAVVEIGGILHVDYARAAA